MLQHRRPEEILPDAEVGGGTDGINTICSRLESADYVIFGRNVEAFWDYHGANLSCKLQQFSRKSKSVTYVTRCPWYVPLGRIFGAKKQKNVLMTYRTANEALEALCTKQYKRFRYREIATRT